MDVGFVVACASPGSVPVEPAGGDEPAVAGVLEARSRSVPALLGVKFPHGGMPPYMTRSASSTPSALSPGSIGVRRPGQLGVNPVDEGLVGLAAADKAHRLVLRPGPGVGVRRGRGEDVSQLAARRVKERGQPRPVAPAAVACASPGLIPGCALAHRAYQNHCT